MDELDKQLIEEAQRELARREFWEYCKLVAPDFYKDERVFLKDMCEKLQEFYEDITKKVLVMNIPPRHGKSRTATLFTQWLFGVDPSTRVMTRKLQRRLVDNLRKGCKGYNSRRENRGHIVLLRYLPQYYNKTRGCER
jgi:hypothetical protein